jgi:hypothetical protein
MVPGEHGHLHAGRAAIADDPSGQALMRILTSLSRKRYDGGSLGTTAKAPQATPTIIRGSISCA